MNFAAEDVQGAARLQAFSQSLRKTGWIEGENLRAEVRWAGDNADRFHQYARELVGLAPDAILASGSASVSALQQVTRREPIVFANVVDPVGAGFVASVARPGGNTTGLLLSNTASAGNGLNC
jgi:putative ABC transport system substrate-binding protein